MKLSRVRCPRAAVFPYCLSPKCTYCFRFSGTHWTCNLLHFLMQTGPLDSAVSKAPVLLELYTLDEVEATPSPRILSTHMKPEMLPPDTFTKGRKIVLLFRNPKDTLVSLFHHMKREKVIGDGFKISWNCFVDAWMQGNCT